MTARLTDCATVCAEFSDWPNTYRRSGEVRRCQHGRVWWWTGSSGYTYASRGWVRLHPWWDRRRLKRAEQVLAEQTSPPERDRP